MTCAALCACLLASGPGPAYTDPLGPYRGQPVLAVDVMAPSNVDAAELRELIDIQAGYLLTPEDVQTALKRLYALGRFSAVELYAERVSGAVLLHFNVKPMRRLHDIEVRGVRWVDEEGLLQALGMPPGIEVDSRTAHRMQTRAERYLAHRGFDEGRVQAREAPSGQGELVSYVLEIQEGQPVRVRTVRFTGTPRVNEAVLRKLVRTRAGDIVDKRVLEGDRQRLLKAYGTRGFLRVQVLPPRVTRNGRAADVVFRVNAGDRIAITLVGNTVFTEDELMQMWPNRRYLLARGDLATFAARIKRRYRHAGFANAQVALRGLRDPARQQINYVFQVVPGTPLEVTEIRFSGADAIPAGLLERQVRAVLLRDVELGSLPSKLDRWEPELALAAPEDTRLAEPRLPRILPDRLWLPALYERAIDDLVAIYRGLGYLSARIEPAVVEPDESTAGRTARVSIAITEGPQYFARSIAFVGNETFSPGALLEVVHEATEGRETSAPVGPGLPLSPSAVEEGRIALIRHYRDHGFLYARVFSDIDFEDGPDSVWGNVAYRFEEGPRVRVQRILVRGNEYTRESTITRRITLRPGDLYRLSQALSDQRAIANLGVFSSVRVKLIDEEQPAEQKDLVAEVVERNRQPLELAPGISTADGPRLRVSYAHINVLGTASTFASSFKLNRQIFFELFGQYERELRRRYQEDFGGTEGALMRAVEREASVGIRSPPIDALPFSPSVRFDLVNERDNALPYSLETAAAILGIDFLLPQRFQLSVEPQISLTGLHCFHAGCRDEARADRFRRIESGGRWTFKAGPSLSFDRRDNPINPTRGIFATVRGIYAYGGASEEFTARQRLSDFAPFSFAKAEGVVKAYLPIGPATAVLGAQAGSIRRIANSRVPIDERFYLGGRSTLRGFIEGALLPEDSCVLVRGDALDDVAESCHETIDVAWNPETFGTTPPVSQGGNLYVLLKSELRVPLWGSVALDLFVDAGNLWAGNVRAGDLRRLRLGVGAGLRYATPVGALAADVGVNPMQRSYRGVGSRTGGRVLYREPILQLHFSVGAF